MLGLTSKLSHQMNMVHLIKCQIIMANLTKPWPFGWTFVHFDQIFDLTLGKKMSF
jgi:hypothetical protein